LYLYICNKKFDSTILSLRVFKSAKTETFSSLQIIHMIVKFPSLQIHHMGVSLSAGNTPHNKRLLNIN